MTLNLATILRESALRRPDRTAIVAGAARLDYRTLDETARRFAGALRRLGVQPHEHVALMLPNAPAFPICYFGGHYAGTPLVPLNVLLKRGEIAYHLDDSGASVLVTATECAAEAAAGFAAAESCRHLIVAGEARGAGAALDALLADAAPVDGLPPTMPDDTAVVLYTSGTTGRPKGAQLTHFNLFYNCEYAARQLTPFDPDAVALACLPLFHSYGQTAIQNTTVRMGGTVVLLERFDADRALDLIAEHRVTHFAGVPTMYYALLQADRARPRDVSSLRECTSGGAPMPVELMRACDEHFGVQILEGYGLSETSPIASFNVPGRPRKPGSIGLPLDGVEFRLIDDDGGVIDATDTPGEICIRGHCVMKGYHARPEATAEAMGDDGWFRTGDIATRDADGFYFIVDRKKDMILRGGLNVYPREVEETLYEYPGVAEAAVIGVPHPELGEEVHAVVALDPGVEASADALIEHCRGTLAAYKYPRTVELRDALPKGPTGKILKRALRR